MTFRLPGTLPLLLVAALSSFVNLMAFQRLFPLSQWWQHAMLNYAWLTRYELAGQLQFVGAFILLFAVYQYAFLLLRRHPWRGPLWLILAGQLLIGAPLLDIYPVVALDVYDYLLYARLALYWDANPLAEPPALYPAEPLLAYSAWPHEPSVYGPLWQLVSQAVTAAVGGALLEGLLAFKFLALASALVTTILIWLTLRHLRPALAPAGALLYAWNPLQQFETAGNAHNDALMVVFLVLALLFLARGPRLAALPAFGAGLLVKITIAPLAPLLGLALLLGTDRWQIRLTRLVLGGLLTAVLVVGLYAPFWEGRASLPFLDRGNWFTASPPTLLRELFREVQPFEAAGRSAAMLSAATFALIAGALLVGLLRRVATAPANRLSPAIIRTGYHLFFAYLVVACLWWQPWYLLVLLALAALDGDQRLADRANLFCLGGLLSYPVFKYIWAVHQTDWQLDYLKIMALSVVVIFSLPLVHLLLSAAGTALRTIQQGRPSLRAGVES